MKPEVRDRLTKLLDNWPSKIPDHTVHSTDGKFKVRAGWFIAVHSWLSTKDSLTSSEQVVADEIKTFIMQDYTPRRLKAGDGFHTSPSDIEFVEARLKKLLGRQ